ncbi:uncharacterized protein LOC113375318 [Ctenocephalides felis]|nr:uncharacterized protein LOC113375318 [Ctenocephalides felis]
MPMSTNTSACCSIPQLFDESLWRSCGIEIDYNTSSEAEAIFTSMLGKCIGDCTFATAGFLNDKDIDFDELHSSIINKTETNSAWSENMPFLVINATLMVDKMHQADDHWQCETKADMFLEYFYALLMINCPRRFWNDTATCSEMKKRFEICPQKLQPSVH